MREMRIRFSSVSSLILLLVLHLIVVIALNVLSQIHVDPNMVSILMAISVITGNVFILCNSIQKLL